MTLGTTEDRAIYLICRRIYQTWLHFAPPRLDQTGAKSQGGSKRTAASFPSACSITLTSVRGFFPFLFEGNPYCLFSSLVTRAAVMPLEVDRPSAGRGNNGYLSSGRDRIRGKLTMQSNPTTPTH